MEILIQFLKQVEKKSILVFGIWMWYEINIDKYRLISVCRGLNIEILILTVIKILIFDDLVSRWVCDQL